MKSRRTPRKSPPANVRVSRRTKRRQQRHVLDVKVRSTKESRIRRGEQAKLVLKAGGLLVLAVGLTAAGKSVLQQAVFEGEGAELTQLEVRTTGALTRTRILETAKVAEGDNLLNVDLAAVRERLESMPQVTSAAVERLLPGKLSIVVREREALAWLRCVSAGLPSHTSNGGHLVDRDGMVFRCDVLLGSYMGLPVIDVNEAGVVRDGAQLRPAEYAAAMSLIERNGEFLPRGGWEIHEVAVKNPYTLLVKYQNDALVTFGTEGMERQLGDVAAIATHSAKVGKHVATMNVMVARNIPVTFYEFGEAFPGSGGGAGTLLPPAGTTPAAVPAGPARGDRRAGQLRGILGGA